MSDLERQLEYTFQRSALLKKAVTHSSFVNEQNLESTASNERLEFLGDAVLQVCVSDMLYHRFHEMAEGELTRRRAALVCEESLANIARRMGLGTFILLGQGEVKYGGREKDSILANAVEALLGAIYLDGGMTAVQHVVSRWFNLLVDKATDASKDSKTMLQEHVQAYSNETAVYEIINESGPPHSRSFTATASHKGRILGTGTGRTKKEAQQNAAKVALEHLGVQI